MAIKIKIILLLVCTLCLVTVFISCKSTTFDKTKYGNCEDGMANQNEEGVDCGGYCVPCANCSDGIKNGEETGIDCGGICASCAPQCTVAPGTVEYTIYPDGFSSAYSNSQPAYSAGYTSTFSEIVTDFSNGVLSRFILRFKDNFNPLDTINIPIKQTMVFTTIDYSSFTVSQTYQVKASFTGNINFSTYSKGVNRDQLVYITRINKSQALIQMCNLKAGTDTISVNVTTY
jgi:hypothetical protein